MNSWCTALTTVDRERRGGDFRDDEKTSKQNLGGYSQNQSVFQVL